MSHLFETGQLYSVKAIAGLDKIAKPIMDMKVRSNITQIIHLIIKGHYSGILSDQLALAEWDDQNNDRTVIIIISII